MNRKYLFMILAVCYIGLAQASGYPRGCEVTGFGYSEQYLILNETGDQTIYLIQNRSDTAIELEHHETRDVYMSPSLKAAIKPNRWAAFASDVANFYFKCYSQKKGHTEKVSCQDVLDICQYPRVKFALSNMGNYWVSTDKSQSRVIKEAIDKGILLRW